jgi:hypothetical protein
MATLPTVTNSRTAQPGSPSGGNGSISFRTRQRQAACSGGSVLPPVWNLRTAFFDGRIQMVRSGCESVRSLKQIDVFHETDRFALRRRIIINQTAKQPRLLNGFC